MNTALPLVVCALPRGRLGVLDADVPLMLPRLMRLALTRCMRTSPLTLSASSDPSKRVSATSTFPETDLADETRPPDESWIRR